MAQAPSVFGGIPGYPPGSLFATREAVRLAGLHRHDMAGISGHYEEGADAIVVSGGYRDDLDEGSRIVYTGEGGQSGGRQGTDQTLTKGNLALARSEEEGLPVRVIRGHHGAKAFSPAAGFRYDGLYTVTEHWSQPSLDGPLIWRYVLEAADAADWTTTPPTTTKSTVAPPAGTPKPGHAIGVVQRVVRNSKVTQWVKEINDHRCQICGIRLDTEVGPYAEGAHIRALGKPHDGPDQVDNVLCLCPNDHVLFDKGAIYLDDNKVYWTATRMCTGALRTVAGHNINWEYVAYHRENFAGLH